MFESRIIIGDVLDILKEQDARRKFDIVIADPPYNIGKKFGDIADNMAMDDYIDWCQEWIEQCFRLLADNGLVYVYGFPEIIARLAVQYPVDQQRWLTWHYTNKAVPSLKFWQRSFESILCLWRPGAKRPNLEIEQIREPYTNGFCKNMGRPRKATNGRYSRAGVATIYKDNGGALPRDVIHIPALAGGAGRAERWFACRNCGGGALHPDKLHDHDGHDIMKHPTQKPIALTQRFIRSRINGNAGRLLVPFAGSGAECVAAKMLDVDYLGVEINPEYARFGRSWLKKCIT